MITPQARIISMRHSTPRNSSSKPRNRGSPKKARNLGDSIQSETSRGEGVGGRTVCYPERVGERGAEAGGKLLRGRHLEEGGPRALPSHLEQHGAPPAAACAASGVAGGGGARVGSRRTEPRAAPAAVAVGRGRGEACAICWKRQFGVRSRASPAVRGTLQHWATKGRERRETETTSSERRKNPTETRRRIVVLPACGPAWKVYWAVRAG